MLATTLAGCLLFPTLSQGADVSLTNAAELRSMTSDKADQRTLAVVEGVVTLYNADWGGFTMQDGTGAIWVTGNTKKPLVPGDRVRVHGKSGAGLYTPVIIADSVESLGSESLPAAVSSDAAELFSGRWDATRVRVRGLVGNVSSDDKMVHFQLYSEGYLIEVQSFIGLGHKPERLSEVEITGICTVVAENVRVRGINLNIVQAEDVSLIRHHPSPETELPFTSLSRLTDSRWKAESNRLFRVKGGVASFAPRERYTLFDGTNGLAIIPSETSAFQAGDLAEAVIAPRLLASGLEWIELGARKTGSGIPLNPRSVTAAEATSGQWNWVPVEIRGKVLGSLPVDKRQVFLLRDQGIPFLAVGDAERWHSAGLPIDPGDEVQVRGILRMTPKENAGQSAFEIQIQQPADIRLLAKPNASSRLLLAILGLLGGVAAGAVIWAWMVQRRTRHLQKVQVELQRQQLHTQQTPLGVIEWNHAGMVTGWNPAAERIFGWKAAEALGQPHSFIVPPEGLAEELDAWQKLIARRGGEKSSSMNLAQDGRRIHCEWYHTVLHDPDNQVTGICSLVHDVTRERELAEQLTSQAMQHAAVLSNLTAGIVLVDRQGHILAANPGAERIFGNSQAGLLGLNFFNCDWRTTRQDGSEIRIFAEMGARCFATGEAATGKICQLVGLDRCARWCSISVSVAEKNGHQQPITVVFSIADITESQEAARRSERLEAELQRSQKMEALGTLAGGIAHDFNNLLAIIMGHAELLGVHVAEEPTARSSVKAIGTAAARGAGLVQRILSFSRPRPPSRTPLLLSEIAREVLQLLKSTLPPAISIETHFAPNEVPVEADSGQLHQVFLNLFTNALQAMEDRKGVLRVAIETIEIDANSKNSPSTLTPGSYVRARIEDSGCGMTETVRRRIFEPFFTTKSPGKGTGLGLAMVHGILTAHGAVISVASNPGRGTRFDLFFHPTRNSLPGTVTGGNQTTDPVADIHILLVDDEPEVLNLTRQMLSALGFQVTSTHLPTDAVKRFEAHPDEFDLLVTDFSMPVMNGRDLLQEIRRVRPQIPGVVISGLAGAIGWENGNIPERTVVLAKPFTSRALWEAIDEAKRTAQR